MDSPTVGDVGCQSVQSCGGLATLRGVFATLRGVFATLRGGLVPVVAPGRAGAAAFAESASIGGLGVFGDDVSRVASHSGRAAA